MRSQGCTEAGVGVVHFAFGPRGNHHGFLAGRRGFAIRQSGELLHLGEGRVSLSPS